MGQISPWEGQCQKYEKKLREKKYKVLLIQETIGYTIDYSDLL